MKKTLLFLTVAAFGVSSVVAQDAAAPEAAAPETAPAAPAAAPAKAERIIGSVKSVTDTALVVTTKQGEKNFTLDAKIRIRKAGQNGNLEDLRNAKQVAVYPGPDGTTAKIIVILDKNPAPAAQ